MHQSLFLAIAAVMVAIVSWRFPAAWRMPGEPNWVKGLSLLSVLAFIAYFVCASLDARGHESVRTDRMNQVAFGLFFSSVAASWLARRRVAMREARRIEGL